MSFWHDTNKDGLRVYGRNAGSPGRVENTALCIASVSGEGMYGSFHPHQCTRKRGKGPDGLYCGIHAKRFKDSQ